MDNSVSVLIEDSFSTIPSLHDLDSREYVYLVSSETPKGLIKIGKTESLKKRLQGLQSQCPVQLRLLLAINAPIGTEVLFHTAFAEYRVHGEWFLPNDALSSVAGKFEMYSIPQHAEIRRVFRDAGLSSAQISEAFRGPKNPTKRPRPIIRYGQLLFV